MGERAMTGPWLWYFAYGANMSRQVLDRRQLSPCESRAARLDDHVLRFSQRGFFFTEPAFANLEPEAGGVVHGVLHKFRATDKDRLDRIEGAEYLDRSLEVHSDEIGRVRAHVYLNPHPVSGQIPSRRYLRCLLDGAREHGLPQHYIDDLLSHPSRHIPVLSPLTTQLVGIVEKMRRAGLRPELIRMRLRGHSPRSSR